MIDTTSPTLKWVVGDQELWRFSNANCFKLIFALSSCAGSLLNVSLDKEKKYAVGTIEIPNGMEMRFMELSGIKELEPYERGRGQ